jgi:hypothetical protein
MGWFTQHTIMIYTSIDLHTYNFFLFYLSLGYLANSEY